MEKTEELIEIKLDHVGMTYQAGDKEVVALLMLLLI